MEPSAITAINPPISIAAQVGRSRRGRFEEGGLRSWGGAVSVPLNTGDYRQRAGTINHTSGHPRYPHTLPLFHVDGWELPLANAALGVPNVIQARCAGPSRGRSAPTPGSRPATAASSPLGCCGSPTARRT